MNNQNKSLFWYGFRANLIRSFGIFLLFISIILGGYGLATTGSIYIFMGVGLIVVSIILIAKGSAQRFDYKMRSGTLVHKGDW